MTFGSRTKRSNRGLIYSWQTIEELRHQQRMSIFTRFGISILVIALAAPAHAQDQADPFAELGLIDESSPVADETAANEENEARARDPGEPVSEEDVLREHARFVRLLQEQNYDAADIAAKRVIEMSIRVFGPQTHETAKALNNLGVVQNNSQQYDAAAQNFSAAIEILEIVPRGSCWPSATSSPEPGDAGIWCTPCC